jgi:hypothetical protein
VGGGGGGPGRFRRRRIRKTTTLATTTAATPSPIQRSELLLLDFLAAVVEGAVDDAVVLAPAVGAAEAPALAAVEALGSAVDEVETPDSGLTSAEPGLPGFVRAMRGRTMP